MQLYHYQQKECLQKMFLNLKYNLFNSYKEWLGKKAYQLMEILPKNEYAPNVHEQWIFKEGEFPALVHDYIITGSYKIAIDTCISKNGLEIQLFSKDDSSDYLFYTMCKQPDFLAKPLDQYVKTENGRLVIERFDLETEIEKVAETLKDILTRIEKYKSRVEGKK